MRNVLFTLGTLALFATSPALADPASHTIGNDDLPVSRATDVVANERTEAAEVVTFSDASGEARVARDEGRAWVPGGTIGDDDEPVSRATDIAG